VKKIIVLDYGSGNLRSAQRALERVGARVEVTADPDAVLDCDGLAVPGVGEMIHAATIAVAGQVPLDSLWHAVPSYPTMSELWLRLLETYGL